MSDDIWTGDGTDGRTEDEDDDDDDDDGRTDKGRQPRTDGRTEDGDAGRAGCTEDIYAIYL